MTRTADHQASHRSANSAQPPPRAPEPAEAVVLTPEGKGSWQCGQAGWRPS
jgi:hypothetical protein